MQDKTPWAIPDVVDEEGSWLQVCDGQHDIHYTKKQLSIKVLDKYADYVLRVVE